MAPMFPLVIIVHADEDLRVARLIEHRGFTEADARARIAAQATEEQRRAVADVWLDNSGSADDLVARARDLWSTGSSRSRPMWTPAAVPPRSRSWCRPTRPGRIRRAASWPGWPPPADTAPCVSTTSARRRCLAWMPRTSSTCRSTVASLDVADELRDALSAAGYPHIAVDHRRTPLTPTMRRCGRSGFTHRPTPAGPPMCICVSTAGPISGSRCCSGTGYGPTSRRAHEYLAVKRRVVAAEPASTADYADAKEPWFVDAYRRAVRVGRRHRLASLTLARDRGCPGVVHAGHNLPVHCAAKRFPA